MFVTTTQKGSLKKVTFQDTISHHQSKAGVGQKEVPLTNGNQDKHLLFE